MAVNVSHEIVAAVPEERAGRTLRAAAGEDASSSQEVVHPRAANKAGDTTMHTSTVQKTQSKAHANNRTRNNAPLSSDKAPIFHPPDSRFTHTH